MTLLVLARRVLIFVGVAGAGIAAVAVSAGGLRPSRPRKAAVTGAGPVVRDPSSLVPLATGAGRTGTSLGPGSGGRLDQEDVAVVGGRVIPWRAYTAWWDTSTPVPSKDGVTTQRLDGARVVFFPRPSAEMTDPVASESAPGVTAVSGKVAWLRRKENSPATVRIEGDCLATHRTEGSDALQLRSELLELRTEERGAARTPVHVVETDQAVRLDGGGSTIHGRGLSAEIDAGRTRTGRRMVRIASDVVATIPVERRRTGPAVAPDVLRISCSGGADVATLDHATRDGRQPWRATFRDDVHAEDAASAMDCGKLEVEFIRTGAADRAAGAGGTEVRSLTATGGVKIDGRGESETWHVECSSLRRFAEDALTDVTVLEGTPLLRWAGRSLDGSAAASVFEVRCTGPATLRERRPAAGRDGPAQLTLVFEGDVVAVETAGGTVRSELRAPLVTMEGRRAAKGRIDPHLLRAEKGAKTRFGDVTAEATTVTAVASQGGGPQRIALVGSPVARIEVPEGASPLGGTEARGVIELAAGTRIDVDVAADPPNGVRPTGTRIAVRTTGGMTARKLVGSDATWRLSARTGDAKLGWDGAIEEMHAIGEATLSGAGTGRDAKRADLSGERIDLGRRPGTTGADAWKQLEAVVQGTEARPAVAALGDANDATRRDEVRATRLVRTSGGRLLIASGGAKASIHRSSAGQGALDVAADEMRIDLEAGPDGAGRPQKLTLTGHVTMRDAMHAVTADQAVYDPRTGEAEASARPPGTARLWRVEDPKYPSYAAGPLVRVTFDTKAAGADRFQRASFPSGGEIVAYFASPARQRVTTRCRGPLELTRTTASCRTDAVCLYESQQEHGTWNGDARIDADRVEMTLDPAVQAGKVSDRIRTLVATGPAGRPARIRTKDPAGRREASAEAERIEGSQWDTKLRLTCPTEGSTVYLHDMSSGWKIRCDSVTFDYVTFEWTNAERWRAVE